MSQENTKKICGIVMPISAIDGCSEIHWGDVLEIVTEAIIEAGFEGNLVSNADEVGIIQKRIIQNLYENPIVVCDVSGKNPNVMFELGMRLAFDKPTIIIKDDKTTYSFDTSPIEHIEYPRDLRFTKIVDFKSKLAEKIKATYEKSANDASFTTFLKHFGEFKVAKIDKKEVSGQEYILDELKSIRTSMRRLERQSTRESVWAGSSKYAPWHELNARQSELWDFDYCLEKRTKADIIKAQKLLDIQPGVLSTSIVDHGDGHVHLRAKLLEPVSNLLQELMQTNFPTNQNLKHLSDES